MMNKAKLPEFIAQFNEFKKTKDYTDRQRQYSFLSIARRIIEETLKNYPLKNEHLTGLIQMLKFNTSNDNFDRYLSLNVLNKEVHDEISNEAYENGESGYTNAGKTAITKLNVKQLAQVRQFLSEAFLVNTIQQAIKLTDDFDALSIPEVKSGIYSPWLHYIKPDIFPIINNTHIEFLAWLEINKKYSSCINDFAELKKATNEKHLGMLDNFAHRFKNKNSSIVANGLNDILSPKLQLNSILYGPPGTGKTYKTILKAAEIIEGRKIEVYDEALNIFNENLHDQIEFITFHQNYSYEDFVQGIRPDTENNKELTFQKKDGIFKIISDRALKNLKESEDPSLAKQDFDIVFNRFIEPISDGDEIEVRMKKTSFHITQITDKSIEFRKNKGDSQHTLSIHTLREMYNKGTNDIILGGLQPYYNPILNIILGKGKTNNTNIQKKNYVLIIDEINRANISRVFGELITLIEPDKRSNGKIPLKVKLPSGDEFKVPSNLYIIGTMNTADKSIALLDIALRRRFVFEAMYPEYDIDGCEIFDIDVLKKINEQIIKTKGHDFQIGHAYFMDNQDNLIDRMNMKVIPLLLEYYMNDEKEVKKLLYGAGLEVIEDSWPIRISGKL